ncbi:redoxin domain-containing protein [bacterium]|nr:MAG: redoxin domain-containing protein [bacterium]
MSATKFEKLRLSITAFLLVSWVLGAIHTSGAAPIPGEKLPPIELATSKGITRSAWLKGRVTVISFCAFWCDTWKEQSRRLDSSRQALQGLPVDWTMISVDGRWSTKSVDGKWSDIARDALLDAGSQWTHRLDVISVPYTLVVDGKGELLFATQGIARGEQLRSAVRVGLGISSPVKGNVHLAIDDFPSRSPHFDDALLDILRARGIKATFYGSVARRQGSPAIVKRAAREGHKLRLKLPATTTNIIDPFDFKVVGENELLRRITGSLRPGKTLLIRSGVRDSVEILPRLLDSAQAQGLTIRE